ncbi:hypothetical protein ANCDUO_16923 [Ancylostoma duodenale]|uniref:Uncharacterized protein n=1 Tax=Ancylostoma duodenale TaxID=51022 RepID=A0A0C2CT44_9BILA|nr:hypothetical protein ANCDUO_16923 [Ancylostoma duodenale]
MSVNYCRPNLNGFKVTFKTVGRVAIHYVETTNPKDNFTFKCHRSAEVVNGYQEIFGPMELASFERQWISSCTDEMETPPL